MEYTAGETVEYLFDPQALHFSSPLPHLQGKVMRGTITEVLPQEKGYVVETHEEGVGGTLYLPEGSVLRKVEVEPENKGSRIARGIKLFYKFLKST